MKIKISSPFLPYNIKDVDFEDFERIDVEIKGVENSNHFLWKLWHLIDIQYPPSAEDEYAPWAYLPHKYKGKKNQVLVLGNINTSLGNFHVAISYVSKGNIDSICFYSGIQNDKITYKKLRKVVLQAKNEMNQIQTFHYVVELCCKFEGLKIHSYVGSHFKLYSLDDKIFVSFDVNCADKYEGYHLGMERMKYLVAFLAVETNILFDYSPIEESKVVERFEENAPLYMQNFIDGYSVSQDVVLLSEEGVRFLDEYIFVERDLYFSHLVKYFLLGCMHVQDAIKEQESFEDIVKASLPTLTYGVMKVQVKNKQEKYTHCIMHYLSAIETASYDESSHEVCSVCGNIKYKIASRVKDFVAKYFNDDLGKLFKGLYAIRSKYLHTGILSTSGDFLNARPILDLGTELGLSDNSFVSVKANGCVYTVSALNIKEWTTFCLRCFYHEKIYCNINFNVEDRWNNNSEEYIRHFLGVNIKSNIEGLEIVDIEPT